MLTGWSVVVIALLYVGALFGVASYGDRKIRSASHAAPRPLIYALSLAVYCTSWTFFGSVGLSASTGYDFLPIYIGPILMFALGWPLLAMIVKISKSQNITSIADFISARYGKNQWLGALVTLIAVIGIVPYISLQLKAVSVSLQTIMPSAQEISGVRGGDHLALGVAIAMAGFAMLFGTRHIDTTEHQDGLILAIAVESVIKLAGFLVLGIFVTFWLMGGFGSLVEAAASNPKTAELFAWNIDPGKWFTMTVLSSIAIFLLPRQFHVAVVENTSLSDVRRAAWMFPVYLVVINLFVAPIAIAGLTIFAGGGVDGDSFVLALPVQSGHKLMVLVAFIGGLSAATAMVIVETIALSIMVCNNLVVPLILQRRRGTDQTQGEIGPVLLMIRRGAIAMVLILAYGYYLMIGSSSALAQTGLLSFAAAAQFAPAFFGGLIWRRATARGAMAGIIAGFVLWAYTLALPLFADAGWFGSDLLANGLFGIDMLRPRSLFGFEMDPLQHGVFFSLAANIITYVAVSYMRPPTLEEVLQAGQFVTAEIPTASPILRTGRTGVTVGQLRDTVARYLGETRTRRSFDEFADSRNLILNDHDSADASIMRLAEHLLARVVGVSSSRLVLALLQERHMQNPEQAVQLLDDASDALSQNRDQLQSAIDHVRQGIAVFDRELKLICWNRQFRHLLSLPADKGQVGVPLKEILQMVLEGMNPDQAHIDEAVSQRLRRLVVDMQPYKEKLLAKDMVLDVRSSKMPDGGIVVTFADITETVNAEFALQQANETLERRVIERTVELTSANSELEQARNEAEKANIDKTRFIAAASHDILQPLNAARLFTSSLVERKTGSEDDVLVRNVDASLEAVEEILNALLDISKLDAGALKPEYSNFPIAEIFDNLRTELTPLAKAKGLDFRIVKSSVVVRSDRQLLRRLIQNLAVNAIKYTEKGRVLIGCKCQGSYVRIAVIDTGPGIPDSKQDKVFHEFVRLDSNPADEPGLGLGLSIVRRIANMLDLKMFLTSKTGYGSRFDVRVPVSVEKYVAPKNHRLSPVLPTSLASRDLQVLVVDNDKSIVEAMSVLLGDWGCMVKTATDAKGALEQIDQDISIILIDYHLDDTNGIVLTQSLREKLNSNIAAVLITADRTKQIRQEAVENNMGYLQKPVKPAALRAALTHAVSSK